MAKALIGYMNSDLRDPAGSWPRTTGCARAWVNSRRSSLHLSEENDKLTAAQAAALLDLESASLQEMQPA